MTMSQPNRIKIFRTADLAITAALSIFGFIVDEVERISPTRSVFIFKDSFKLQEIIKQYWRSELKVEPQAYFNQLKVLKARIYER
ncbi:MAG: DUF5659 domain-containing protein [Candidatus Pacebacteria bacterium]|nr:DUF5659 domain-containing protein [Candidatus Paceibacterota bacterium]